VDDVLRLGSAVARDMGREHMPCTHTA
jgi:hypothetical protein